MNMNRKQRRAAAKHGKFATRTAAQNSAERLAEALRFHQAGHLTDAERLYREILATDSEHADSLHLLGVIAIQTRQYDTAVALIGQAIAIEPTSPAYYSNLGNALRGQGKRDEAAQSFRRALTLKPDYPEAHNNLGLTLKDQGRLDAAADCYRAAIALRPDYANAHSNLGVVLQEQGLSGEAIACYRKALEIKPDFPEVYNNLGNALRALRQLDQAVICYRQALARYPKYADAHYNLGLALQSQGRFEEASASHNTALGLGADPCGSYYELSRCRKFTEADHRLIARMQALLNDRTLSDTGRAQLHFALGKIFDDLADYGTAIQHFDEANRFDRRDFDRSGFTALVDRMIAAFPQDAPIASSPSQSPPSDSQLPVFIVGLPRSGTTLTEQILASHPQVGSGGELDFWPKTLESWETEPGPVAIRDYLALLSDMGQAALRVVDKMPYNFIFLGFLHRQYPNARIIHCRRHPVDTALSIYFTRFSATAGFARMNGFAYSRSDIVFYCREYARLMAHWRAVLPPDRFVEIDYEQLVADPESVSRRLVAFCGLEWDAACRDFHKIGRPIETASAWQARQPIYRTSTGRWRRYEPWLGELRDLASTRL